MKKTNVIKRTTKSGRKYNNFQVPAQSANPKTQQKNNEDAIVQAAYEAHCLL